MEPNKEDITKIYKPLSESKYPIYAVLGNHDVEKP
jgi:predicted MPP superfamily phosphohydrolase